MLTIVQTALEAGVIYALVALALFLSYTILDIADLTTDGAFTLGCAVSATVCLMGHPVLALPMAMLAGAAAGFVTAFLQTKLGVPSILAGIITNFGLYSVNLTVMGSANVNLYKSDTIFSLVKETGFAGSWHKLLVPPWWCWLSACCWCCFWAPGWGCPSGLRGTTPIWCALPPSTRSLPSRWACASPTP